MHKHTRAHRLRERAIKISERSGAERGDEYDYENPKVTELLRKANELDERSRKKMLGKMGYDERGGMNEMNQEIMQEEVDRMLDERGGIDSPMNACAKSEGGSGCIKEMGGAWRVISNKTDKPWPAKYTSKAKAEAALRGYHAG